MDSSRLNTLLERNNRAVTTQSESSGDGSNQSQTLLESILNNPSMLDRFREGTEIPSLNPRAGAVLPGGGLGQLIPRASIQSLNEKIYDLEQNGEDFDGQLDALRDIRDSEIERYTGSSDASLYDKNIVALAQTNGISYNAAVDVRNASIMAENNSRPPHSQLVLAQRVENLPWEHPTVNARVDQLTSEEGLSYDAAVVVAMTERRPTFSIEWNGFRPSINFNRPSNQGEWQSGFADRIVRSGPEIAQWAESKADASSTATINLTAGNDNVTVTQRDDGQLVVSYVDGSQPDQIINPAEHDRIIIMGGSGNDRITVDESVSADLVIAGGDGNDKIFSGGGNDILIGGNGDDLIRGSGGSDVIIGGDGDDNLEGGDGGDIIQGNAGADYVSGGNGNDSILGGIGRDTLYGGHGEDLIMGQSGNDNINGGTGKDYLDGGTGDDLLVGGKGDDRLKGGSGSDTFIGTSGLDTYLDSARGDSVIMEASETASADADIDIVEIDPELGNARESVVDGNREEFITRLEDDFELLRSTRSGQEMLTALEDHEATMGNKTQYTELDSAQDTVNIAGINYDPENGIMVSRSERIEYGDEPSAGADALIYYNPTVNVGLNEGGKLQPVPPVVVLFHEMSHAFNATNGTLLGSTNRLLGNADDGISNAEMQAVGLDIGVDHDSDPATAQVAMPNFVDQPTENDIRAELGIDLRTSYRNFYN